MDHGGHLWIILLAGGSGTRVRHLIRDEQGEIVPKQYWRPQGGASMLGWALDRARALAPPERITAVVARDHARWWGDQLDRLPAENILDQPADRGTAAGALLPLLHVLERDPEARVVLMPTDHFTERENVVRSAIAEAARIVRRDQSRILLLGTTPGPSRAGYGWMLPGPRDRESRAARIEGFAEKPDAATADLLVNRGALANMFVICADGGVLLDRFRRAAPDLTGAFRAGTRAVAPRRARWDTLYASLPPRDLSTGVLHPGTPNTRVLPVPPCGWLDLGTPERLTGFLRRRGSPHPGVSPGTRPVPAAPTRLRERPLPQPLRSRSGFGEPEADSRPGSPRHRIALRFPRDRRRFR